MKNYTKLDKKAMIPWIIARAILLISFVVIGIVALKILAYFNIPNTVYFYFKIGIICVFVLLLLNVLVYPIIEYKQWGYIINDEKVEIKRGLYFIECTVIPVIRIQHIEINSGPLNRMFNLVDLEINTASGMFFIKGLNSQLAEKIAENLQSKVYERLQDETD